jgi:hypothetical protein
MLALLLLAASGRLDAGVALGIGLLIELGIFLVVLWQIVVVARRYRRNRAAGLDFEAALEDGLARIFPRRFARLLALEPRLWSSLFRWLFRRRPPTANEFRYTKHTIMGMVIGLVLFTAPVELFIIELLIPWPVVRWILLFIAVYSAIWLLGLYAAMKVRPHRLDPDGLRLYNGIMADGYIPYDQITAITAERRRPPKDGEGLQVAPAERAAYLAIGGRTDLTLRLRAPVILQGLLTPTPPVLTVHFTADEPDRLVAALRERTGLPADDGPATTPAPRGATPSQALG